MAASSADDVRVVYVIGGRRIGGMETHLIALASNLPASVRCVVCCLDASDEYRARLAEARIEHVNLGWPALLRPDGILAYQRLRRVVRRFRPHLVHAYGFAADVAAALLRAGGVNVPLITSRRGEDDSRRHQAIRRLVNRISDRIVCVSQQTAAFVAATESPAPRLLEVIPNGVAADGVVTRPHARSAHEPIRFGTLGTVKPIKGTDLLVDAFMRFPPGQRVELDIAGLIDRPWAEALRERARTDARIRFVGRSSAPREFLSSLDVFVLPSRSEGMSNALLEAMAAGLPCIATDVGSNRSLVEPSGEPAAGLIAGASADSLFQAMDVMAARPDVRLRCGTQGAALVRTRHTIPGMVSQYERLYRSLVARPSPEPSLAGKTCVTE
jgi:glycosyltransferase involved in cell wall biosynthesis